MIRQHYQALEHISAGATDTITVSESAGVVPLRVVRRGVADPARRVSYASLVAAEPLVSDPVAMEVDEDGRIYVVEMHGYPLDLSGSGRVILLTDAQRARAGAVMRDLRSELSARAALMESEKRWRIMIEQAPVAIGLLRGRNLVIEAANESIHQLWGKKDVVGKRLVDAFSVVAHR